MSNALAHRRPARPVERTKPLGPSPTLQRAAGNAVLARHLGSERSPVLDVIAQPGRPLEPKLRAAMEQRLGEDFSDVRVHTGSAAAQSARSVDALAYTVGENIVLGREATLAGEGGQQLLAHELAHVIQQRQGPVDGKPAPGGIKVSEPGDRFERAADRLASQVASGGAPRQVSGAMSPTQSATRLDVTTVQTFPFDRYLTSDYWKGRSSRRRVAKNARGYTKEIAKEQDTEKLLRGKASERLEASRGFARGELGGITQKIVRTAFLTLDDHQPERRLSDLSSQERQAELEGVVTDLVMTLVPLMFPHDAGYVKGELFEMIATTSKFAQTKQWQRGSGQRAAEMTVVDMIFLRTLCPALINATTNLAEGTIGRRALIDATTILQILANGADVAESKQPAWKQEIVALANAGGERDQFMQSLMSRVAQRQLQAA